MFPVTNHRPELVTTDAPGHNPHPHLRKVNNDLIFFKTMFIPSSHLRTSLSLMWKREPRPLQARVGSLGIIFQKPGAWQGFPPSLGTTPHPAPHTTSRRGKGRAPATGPPPPTVWPCSREAKRSCPERLGTWPGNPKLRGLPPAEKGRNSDTQNSIDSVFYGTKTYTHRQNVWFLKASRLGDGEGGDVAGGTQGRGGGVLRGKTQGRGRPHTSSALVH